MTPWLYVRLDSGEIASLDDAVEWMSKTYYAIRLASDPTTYNLSPAEVKDEESIRAVFRDDCRLAVEKLWDKEMVEYDRE